MPACEFIEIRDRTDVACHRLRGTRPDFVVAKLHRDAAHAFAFDSKEERIDACVEARRARGRTLVGQRIGSRLPQQGFVEIGTNAHVITRSLKNVADWIDDEKERIGKRAFRERGFDRRWTIAPKRERFGGRS